MRAKQLAGTDQQRSKPRMWSVDLWDLFTPMNVQLYIRVNINLWRGSQLCPNLHYRISCYVIHTFICYWGVSFFPFTLHKTQQWRIVWPISQHKNGKMQILTSKQWKRRFTVLEADIGSELPSTILLKPSALLNDKPTWSPQTLSYDNIVSAAINMCKITDEGGMLPTKMLQSSFAVEKMADNTSIATCHYYWRYRLN